MAQHEIKLPAMGEGIIEAIITRWLVEEGAFVNEDDPIVEIATDKVDSEIPSPFTGTMAKILYKEGEIPKVGETIAVISNDMEKNSPDADTVPSDEYMSKETIPADEPDIPVDAGIEDPEPVPEMQAEKEGTYISPFIRDMAKRRGIPFAELANVKGTGKDNRITKDDILNYIQSGRTFRKRIQSPEHLPHKSSVISEIVHSVPDDFSLAHSGETDIVKMDRIRKIIADNMLKSKRTAPHVTSFAEVDVTDMVLWREKIKHDFSQTEGVNITYTVLFTEIVALALKEFPKINASVDGDKILIKKEINIGIATALQNGNLVVPVIKNTDKENVRGLSHKIHDLAMRARQNKLFPNEIRGGTFTITNIGQYNSITGTPIINLPEVAILAIGIIKKKPAVVYMPGGPGIAIRDIVILSLTYDHRIIDGALGGEFLNRIAYHLEHFNRDKTW